MKILGIETSCDETAAAVVEVKGGQKTPSFLVLSNVVSSQIPLHKKYGGVYPELAARAHLERIVPVIKEALSQADTSLEEIDLIAVTHGPGLIGSLLVGVNMAKTIAYLLRKPIVPVNHLEGHLYAPFGKQNESLSISPSLFPALGLVISGGHTELFLIKEPGRYQLLGRTRDDAVGEAFDKVAKMIGLGYPGGPALEKEALKKAHQKMNFRLPRPMIKSQSLDFSFAGLKTAVLYSIQHFGDERLKKVRPLIAAEFQQSIAEVLSTKLLKATENFRVKSIILGGGVIANKTIQQTLKRRISRFYPHLPLFIPDPQFCTDNAAMIAIAGYIHWLKKGASQWYDVFADANAEIA